MRRLTRPACHVALLSTTIISSAFAQEGTAKMDAVTVYATRSEQSTLDVPAIVSQIDTNAAGAALSGDVGDILEFTPAVEVANGPRRNGQTVTIRGFDSEAIITMIDGRRQNYESAHDGRFFLDTSLLKSVEVVKGASSSIYGGGALGGVVAFETKDAGDFLAPGQSFGATTSLGVRTANDEFSGIATGYGRAEGWDLLGSFAYRKSGDIETGAGTKLDTDDKVLSGLIKASVTLADFHTLKLQTQVLNNDGQEPNNGSGAISVSNPLVNKEVEDQQFSIRYAYDQPGDRWFNPSVHLYFNNTDVTEQDITGSNTGRVQIREIDTIGFNLDNQSRIATAGNIKHVLSYGFEIYQDEQTGSSTSTGPRAGVPNAEADTYGFYVQDEISFEGEAGRLLVIPAARYDHYESDDENGSSQDEGEISPKLSMSYLPYEGVMIFGSWAKAFRAPNLTEIYSSGQHFPGVPGFFPANFFIPNPDLKPETVTTIEIGAGFDQRGVFAKGDRFKVKGSWYTSDGEDFIDQTVNVFAGTTTNSNVPNADLTGWEIEGQYAVDLVTARVGVSTVTATNEDTGAYLGTSVPVTFVTDFNYRLEKSDGLVGWRGRFASDNDKVPSGETPTDGYMVHDLYYRWAPDSAGLDALTVDLGVENVFDKAYTKRFASLLEEGRSFTARVSYSW